MQKLTNTYKPREKCICPALIFEDAFGFEDIGKRWNMPHGQTLEDAEFEMWGTAILRHVSTATSENLEYANLYADMFINLNPELAVVDFDSADYESTRDFVHGIVSGFNIDDIKSFLSGNRHASQRDALADRLKAQLQKTPSWIPMVAEELSQHPIFNNVIPDGKTIIIQWMPSLKTIERINDQCDQKDIALETQTAPQPQMVQAHTSPLPGGFGAVAIYIPR
jgi:hypothetical protein